MSALSTMEFHFWEHLITVVFVIAIAGIAIWAVITSLNRRRTPKSVTCRASVLSKSADACISQPVFIQDKQVSTGLVEKGCIYTARFQTESDRELTFSVSQKFYEALIEGQSGLLTYRGSSLIQFSHLQNTPVSDKTDFKGLQENL